jgi:hypothetical protein
MTERNRFRGGGDEAAGWADSFGRTKPLTAGERGRLHAAIAAAKDDAHAVSTLSHALADPDAARRLFAAAGGHDTKGLSWLKHGPPPFPGAVFDAGDHHWHKPGGGAEGGTAPAGDATHPRLAKLGRHLLHVGSAALHSKLGRVLMAVEHGLGIIAHKFRDVAKEAALRRKPPMSADGVQRLGRLLAVADFIASGVAGGIVGAVIHPVAGKITSTSLPTVSVLYLAYSAARDPAGTWAAARQVAHDTLHGTGHKAAELGDPGSLADALAALLSLPDADWREAVFLAALAEGVTPERAAQVAAAAPAQPAELPTATPADFGEEGDDGLAAKSGPPRPGLVPETGDPQHPGHWVRPDRGAGGEGESGKPDPARAAADYKENGVKAAAFKDWFGDWENDPAGASKVVKADGSPAETFPVPTVVYHGSRQSHGEFKPGNSPGVVGFFSESEAYSHNYGDVVRPFYLSIRRPLDLRAHDGKKTVKEWLAVFAAAGVDTSGIDFDAEFYPGDKMPYWGLLDASAGNVGPKSNFVAELRRQGFDGIAGHEGGAPAWAALDPRQVKAVDNAGTFDPTDPHTRKAHGPPPFPGGVFNEQSHHWEKPGGDAGGRPPRRTGNPGVDAALAEYHAAPDGSLARDALDAALNNMGVEDPAKPPKKLGLDTRQVAGRLVDVWLQVHRVSNAAAEQLAPVERALAATGAKPVGEAGSTLPFDGRWHQSESSVTTGTPVRVVRPGWVLPEKDGGVYRLQPARVEPAGKAADLGDAELDALILKHGFTGRREARDGSHRCYQDGRPVPCPDANPANSGKPGAGGANTQGEAKPGKRAAPGSQLPAADRDRLRSLGMVGTFPPADVPPARIKMAPADADPEELKFRPLMQWDQVTGSGRVSRQYRYTQAFHDRNAATKFDRVMAVEPHLAAAGESLRATMADEKAPARDRDAAAVASVIMETGLRPTDGDDSVKHGHYGIASLLARHVKVEGGRVELDFVGKEGVRNRTTITDPANVAYIKARLAGKKPDDPLWEAGSDRAGDALKAAVVAAGGPADVKLKDLRTVKATQTARRVAAAFPGPPPPLTGDRAKDAKAVVSAVLKMSGEVAAVLNNTAPGPG